MKNYYKNLRPEVYQIIPNQSKIILEIGCGEGEFSNNFNRKFITEYWGIDLDKKSVEVANTKLDKVFHGDFDDIENKLPNGHFDLVICNDVIEHMKNAEEFMVKIKAKLNPCGFLVGSIPNIRHYSIIKNLLFNGDWRYEDFGIMDKTHLKFFTKKSMMRMFENSGYKVLHIDGINKSYPSNKFFSFISKKIISDEFLYQQYIFRLSKKQ
jgi:2-polyprenyl-3-methyl-5-hydroxy-6-metoxy-1,4-benzoquinol methylase